MFRYVALVWEPANPTASAAVVVLRSHLLAASSQWRDVMRTPGVDVLCADERPPTFVVHRLAGSMGIVLGAVLSRTHNDMAFARLTRFTRTQSADILDSEGRSLITDYWGNYVALLRTIDPPRVLVLKDPTGSLPCFVARHGTVHIVFACITDALAMGLRFTINEAYLRECVLSGGRNQELAPLTEMTRVHGGECVTITADASHLVRRLYWNPLSFARRSDTIENPAAATVCVRHVLSKATHAWVSGHEHVLHRLSGGLDSSIVLACLTSAPSAPRITCYTYYDPNGRMDERPWARLATQNVHCDHMERAFDPSATPLSHVLAMRPTAYPTSYIGYLFRSALERELFALTGAALVFSGDGGDSGFCSDSVGLAVAEYLRCYGPRPYILRLASQVGLRVELSAWTVLRRSITRWLQGSRMSDQREGLLRGAELVSAHVREAFIESDHYPHPWFSDAPEVPWAVIRRMGRLVYAPEFHDPSMQADDTAPVLTAPMYSQPVIEALLRIPMHVHFLDGRDRGLARRAFEGEVPEAILRRTWKDSAPGYFDRVVASNREFLRSLLLDGVLVERGLLDRAAVEQALAVQATQTRVLPGEILKHMDTEVWARAWISPAGSKPAQRDVIAPAGASGA